MNPVLDSHTLQSCYTKELIKAGVKPQKAQEAAVAMTSQELLMIGDIWPQWAAVLTGA